MSASEARLTSLVNIWKLLSRRTDVDDIILELLGRFSLEKLYADTDKERYQRLVINLLAQLNTIFYFQRLSIPSENLHVGPHFGLYLGLLASWEVILRSVEFILQSLIEGRDSLWDAQCLRNKYLAEFLISALRILCLHPRGPAHDRLEERRVSFMRIHRSLAQLNDSFPGPKSFLLYVCEEVTRSLNDNRSTLALPTKLRNELPTLVSELYPLPDCLSAEYVSTIVPKDGGFTCWLSQLLALRDVTYFVIGASIQHAADEATRDVRGLRSASAETRDAIFATLNHMELPRHFQKPEHFQKDDVIATFSENFQLILPDTPNTMQSGPATESFINEMDIGSLETLRARLSERRANHRVSDQEMMQSVSRICREISHLDDPKGEFRSPTACPRLFVLNCSACHLIGKSQLKYMGEIELPERDNGANISLPQDSRCMQCGEVVSRVREIPLARRAWKLLKPLENNADTISVERHMRSQFRLGAPRTETAAGPSIYPYYPSHTYQGAGPVSPINDLSTPIAPVFSHGSAGTGNWNQTYVPSPITPDAATATGGSRRPSGDSKETSYLPNLTSIEETIQASTPKPAGRDQWPSPPHPYDISSTAPERRPPGVGRSVTVFGPVSTSKTRSPVSSENWGFFKMVGRSKRISTKASQESSSQSSGSAEHQMFEVQLESIITGKSSSVRNRVARNVNVSVSKNSTHVLFWTQPSIQVMDVGVTPPSLKHNISTESSCLLATVTKRYLAYIMGTRDQRLTLRVVNLDDPSASVIEYRMLSSPWCKSITIRPTEDWVVVGFESSVVRFFSTTRSDNKKEFLLPTLPNQEPPSVDTVSFSSDGQVLVANTRSRKTGMVFVYAWRYPFTKDPQELSKCRYSVPLLESEDNGVSSVLYRSKPGLEEDLVCVTTWTQSGIPILIQPHEGHKRELRTDPSSRQGKLGSRIQCAAFSSKGKQLAMVNDKGHVYQISNLNSSLVEARRLATTKELTTKSDSFDMSYMAFPEDEEAIVLAWADAQKGIAVIKKIPIGIAGDGGPSGTPFSPAHHVELPGGDVERLAPSPSAPVRPQLELPAQENEIPAAGTRPLGWAHIRGSVKNRIQRAPVELPATDAGTASRKRRVV